MNETKYPEYDHLIDPNVLKFKFHCPCCQGEHFQEMTDSDIEEGLIGPERICKRCQKLIDKMKIVPLE